jgi:FkbM family methyltransferase
VNNDALIKVINLAREVRATLAINTLEIGSRPLEGIDEPFYQLPKLLPGSRIISFDPGADLAESSDSEDATHTFFPVALAKGNESRKFYETNDPACSSLFPPNEDLAAQFNRLEVQYLKETTMIETRSMDDLLQEHDIRDIDFVKIDVQGAEVEVFKGGVETLRQASFIVSEVIFVPMYYGQALFGDVCNILTEQDFMFHKFLGLAGRSFKPIILNNNPTIPTQHLWSDAVYVKGLLNLQGRSTDTLLKIAILAFIYGSPDLTFKCFNLVDQQENTEIAKRFFGSKAAIDQNQ